MKNKNNIFKKTCCKCGAKEDYLIESICTKCYSIENPPIKEIKPPNLKICNMCQKIHYQSGLFSIYEIESMMPNIVKKNISLNKNYNLEEINIENFEINGHKLMFDIKIKTKIIK